MCLDLRILIYSEDSRFRRSLYTSFKNASVAVDVVFCDSLYVLSDRLDEDEQAVVICDLRKKNAVFDCLLYERIERSDKNYYVIVRSQPGSDNFAGTGGAGLHIMEVASGQKDIMMGTFLSACELLSNTGQLDRIVINDAHWIFDYDRDDLDECVRIFLGDIGINWCLVGSDYLSNAVCYVLCNSSLKHAITKELYPLVGKSGNSTPVAAERAIRRMIGMAWKKEKVRSKIKKTFADYNFRKENGMPVNSELIIASVAIVKSKLRSITKIVKNGIKDADLKGRVVLSGSDGVKNDVISIVDLFRWLL